MFAWIIPREAPGTARQGQARSGWRSGPGLAKRSAFSSMPDLELCGHRLLG